MESLAKLHCAHQPLQLSLHRHSPSFLKPFSSLRSLRPSFRRSLSIRASVNSSSSSSPNPKPKASSSTLLTTACTAIAVAAFAVARFQLNGVAIAAPLPAETETETEQESTESEILENVAEETPSEESPELEALRTLMEEKVREHKLGEAIEALDKLIALEPEDFEWPLMKANIHSHMGENELAKDEFEKILKRDPLRVEAYHGLIMAASQSGEDDNLEKISGIVKRVEAALKSCEKQKNKSEARDFKLLIAQIRVLESNYDDALKLYEELVKEEPRDFRPYLCQGIIYTLLSKSKEAQKQFDTFRKLVPKNHPYREYFEDNMLGSKLFSSRS